ncbi:MAG: flippase-like domain-containing protein, partial [Chloroflexia bacterium]|nr:flippase-like domain-containing protein [Chloroflexia bacterium]
MSERALEGDQLDRAMAARPLANAESELPVAADEGDGAPQPLGRRFLRPETLVSFAIAAVILFFAVRGLRIDPAAVWATVRRADPWFLLAALAVWYCIFVARALRWRGMLARVGADAAHGYSMPTLGGIYEILILSWFANCVVPAKLGDAYRCYLLKRESRVPFSTGLGTVIAERLSDLLVLCVAMAAAGALVFGGRLPAEAFRAFELGVVLVVAAAVGLAAMWLSRHTLQRRLPSRIREQYGRLHGAIFGSLRRPAPVLAVGAVIWLGEGLRFWLVSRSVDAPLPFAVALFIALMGALLTTIPLTPAGLGVVEAGTGAVMVGVLGLDPDLSFAVIFLDRVVSYWSLIAIGLVVYLRRFGRET